MALGAVTNAVITRNAATAMGSFVDCVVNEGLLVTPAADDAKVVLHIKNAITNATHTAVITKGNGLQGVSDLEITLAASTEKVIVVESGAYKQVSGDNKGKILIKDKSTTNTNAISVAAVVLP
jgi:hypothetical protein